jgi:KaiC/GvpD/RAD55 family RecA-like ATPase
MITNKTEKIKTGIPGFDEICNGGLLRNRAYVVEGMCGAGKSIFGLQFLYNGAVQYNEPGMLLSTEERPDSIRANASNLGWNLAELEGKGMLSIIDGSFAKIGIPSTEKYLDFKPSNIDKTILTLIKVKEDTGAKRLVVDSLTALSQDYLDRAGRYRKALLKMTTLLDLAGLTTLFLVEARAPGGVESFVTEGAITLYFKRKENLRVRGIEIHKLRGSDHSHKIHAIDIGHGGIVVHPAEELYGEFD